MAHRGDCGGAPRRFCSRAAQPSRSRDSNVVGLALATLWLASAVVLATGTRKALYVVIVGSFALLAHGVVTRAGGSTLGLVYLGLAPLVVLLERIALGSKLVWGRTAEEPTRAEHARTSV